MILLLLLIGCAPVPAYERGALMTPLMAERPALEASIDQHVMRTREAMRGADGAGGASCGCN